MTAKDNTEEKVDPGVVNPAFVAENLEDSVDIDKDDISSKRSDGDGMSDTDSISSTASTSSAPDISKFNLKTSPRPLRRSHRSHSQQPSPESYRSSYQSNRSSVCSTRKGILKKTASSTTINMEMCNISQPQTPTDNGQMPRMSDAFDDNYLNGDISRFSRSTDDVPLHHQRSFNRVKFILDSGRPDNVTGDYDDIKIEKNDRSQGLDRGKTVEKDNSGLSKSGRRCLLFTAGLLVLTMAVILGSLFGSRKLSNIPVKSVQSPINDKLIRNAIEGSFKITNKEFVESLQNYESEEFKKMSKDLEALIAKVIYHEATPNHANSTANLRIIKILKGSLVPLFRIKWKRKDELSGEEIRKRIMRHLDRFGSIGEYKVDKTSVTVTDLQNNCHKSITSCSHTCVLVKQTLRFLCRCPDTLVLTNNTICTSPQQPTRQMPFIVPPVVNTIIKDSGAQFHSVNPETVEKKTSAEIIRKPSDDSQLKNSTEKTTITSPSTNKTLTEDTGSKANADSDDVKKKVNVVAEEEKPKEKVDKIKKEKKKEEGSSDTKDLKKGDEVIMIEGKKKTEEKEDGSSSKIESEQNIVIKQNDFTHGAEPDDIVATPKPNKEDIRSKLPTKLPGANETNKLTTKFNNNIADEPALTSPIIIKTTMPPQKSESTTQITTLKDKSKKVIEISPETDPHVTEEVSKKIAKLNTTEHIDMKITKTELLPLPGPSTITPDPTISSNTISTIASADKTGKFPINLHATVNAGNVENETKISIELNDDTSKDAIEQTKKVDLDLKEGSEPINTLMPETSKKDPIMMTNHTVKDVASTESLGMANFTNIPSNETSLYYNASGSFEDKIITSKNDSTIIHFITNKVVETDKLQNKTVLDILLPSQAKTPQPPSGVTFSNDDIAGKKESTEASVTNQSTSSGVVTVQAIPLSELITPPTGQSTSPIISVLLGSSSTRTLESSTQSSKGSNDILGKPINIGDIADISNILSSGNMSSSQDIVPESVKTSQDALNSSTTMKNIENDEPFDESLVLKEENLCSSEQFQCASGTSRFGVCIPMSSRCDSVYDCFDRSDETDCIANKCFGNYQCWSGDCIQREYVCDGIRHCADGGDEEGCETWTCSDDEFKCGSTKGKICIPSSQRCDGQSDCFDNSDERNCSKDCSSDQFLCPEGWCIPNIWKCDGTSDCAAGEDEQDCDCDGLDQSPCAVGGCVPTFKLCDGLRQCPDGSDEYGCIRIHNKTKQLEVRSEENRWSPVCGDKWTNEWTELVCEQLGFGEVVSTEVKKINESVPRPRVKLSPDAPKVAQRRRAPLQYFLTTPGKCAADPLVHVSCKQPTCGIWSRSSTGSSDDELEDPAWPSLGLLVQLESYEDPNIAFTNSCAATAITPVWVIASYSCLLSRPNGLEAGKWAFLIGESSPSVKNIQTTNKGNTNQRKTQLRYAKQVVVHPGAKKKNGLWVGDAALLRLQSPLELDGSTNVACLPDKPIGTHSHCKIASWTETNKFLGTQDGVTQSVQRLPVPNLTTKTCNISYYNGKLDSSHVCASFMQNSHSPCKGKEGSPLMCKNDDGSWQIHGLLSMTSTCARFEIPSLFTDISHIKKWVMNTVEIRESSLLTEMTGREGLGGEGTPIARALHNAKTQEIVPLEEESAESETPEIIS